jgi:transposase-like protein
MASSEKAALLALDALNDTWGARYPAMIRSWRIVWS